jgi:hypothetical protein
VLHPLVLGSYDEQILHQGLMQGYTAIACTALQSDRLLLGLDMGVLELPRCRLEADAHEWAGGTLSSQVEHSHVSLIINM